MRSLVISVAVMGLLTMTACSKKPPAQLPPAPTESADEAGRDAGDGQTVKGSQADFVASVAADRVFFDTDQSTIDAEDQAVLRSQAQWLAANPRVRVTLEGHCDERGTRDYNLALGERRANAAKNYLASLGVDPARISTVSYGKERPDALGSEEGAWARNRRAVTVVVE